MKPSRKKNSRNLISVLIISAIVHVVAFMILGSIVIFQAIVMSESEFEAAIPPESIEPEQLQVQRDMRQRSKDTATKAQPQQRITINNPALVEVQAVELTVAPPSSGLSLDGAGGTGLGGSGGGLGQLGGSGGINVGRRPISFLGVESSGERVAIVVDCSNHMLLDEKGGLYAFRLVKEECVRVIESLEPGVVFNIYLYGDTRTVNRFKPHMVIPAPAVINEVKAWLAPINENPSALGAGSNNFEPDREYFGGGAQAYGNFPRALHAAFQDQAEVIFMITATWPRLRQNIDDFTGAERQRVQADLDRRIADWERNHRAAREVWLRDVYRPAVERAKKINEEENARRRAQGKPPRIFLDNDHMVRELGQTPPGPRPPHRPVPHLYQPIDIINRFRREMYKDFYRDKQKELPSLNIILFGRVEDAEDNLRQLARTSRSGNLRVIPSLAELEAARAYSQEQRQR